MDLFAALAQGLARIDTTEAIRASALKHLQTWISNPEYAAYRPQIEWLVAQERFADLLDAFYQVLPFGTGGRRGAVGIGPNRFNLWTLGASVQGHCDYLRQRFPGVKELHVVLAFDVRRFLDQRKVYHPDLPNPVLGLTSRDFAQHAAGVYAANGIIAHLTPPESPRYVATPELSFTIRHLRAHGGLNISASHNPPDDNGGKFYDERGAQPVPPDDQIMSDLVEQVTAVRHLPFAEAVRAGKVRFLDEQPHRLYIELCRKQSVAAPPRFDELTVVFTPLHGVGSMTALEVLTAQGFRPIPVEEQMQPDGQFPNVTGTPNPEIPAALDRAEALARQVNADLALATDPDADRIGALAADGRGGFRYLTGQELCALVTHFRLAQLAKQNRLPASPLIVTTEVTTTLVTRIARSFGAQVINNLLVGFKYIAEVLRQLEETGRYEDIQAKPSDFVLGTEESHGIQAMAEIRDKDAGAAALLVAELALEQKRRGQTILHYLDMLARQFGYFRNDTFNIVQTGIAGKAAMARMLDRLRSDPPTQLAGLTVTAFEDWRDESGRLGPLRGQTDAAARNFLVLRMGDARQTTDRITARVVLRPSGTEPKAKAYVEVCSGPCPPGLPESQWLAQCAQVDALAKQLGQDFLATIQPPADAASTASVAKA
jgi:phosphoglucomutase